MSKSLVPKYTWWETANAALSIGMRALEEIRALARTPGPAGKDGRDGVSYDDFDEEYEDEGRFLVRTYMLRGEVVKTKRFLTRTVLDRGVFKEGRIYLAGDGVSYGGSWWIAQDETKEKPDSGKGWRLAVKAGRNAKSAYDIAKTHGFAGNESDWVEMLVGRAKPKTPIKVG